MSPMTTSLAPAMLALSLVLPLAAQSASGTTHLLVASECSAGGNTQSAVHRLTGAFAPGVAAARATSTNHVLVGGFLAALDLTIGLEPQLTGVVPAYGPLLGGTSHTLHGAALDQGPSVQVTIGGQPAFTGARTSATVQATLPPQPRPGYQPVTVQTVHGSATLPKGMGVLPLLDFPVAHQPLVPVDLRYLGAQNDQVVFVLAVGTLPFVLSLPPFHHGLELDPTSLLVLSPVPVVNPSGELRIRLPAAAPPLPIYLQAFALTQAAGWFPGSFTNVARL